MQLWGAALNGMISRKVRICCDRCRMFPCAIHTTNSHSQSIACWPFLNRQSRPHLLRSAPKRLRSGSLVPSKNSHRIVVLKTGKVYVRASTKTSLQLHKVLAWQTRLLLLLCCCRTLFGVGDKGVEARVAVKRFEIGVFFYAQIAHWGESVIDRLVQKRQCLVTLPPEGSDATQNVRRKGG